MYNNPTTPNVFLLCDCQSVLWKTVYLLHFLLFLLVKLLTLPAVFCPVNEDLQSMLLQVEN